MTLEINELYFNNLYLKTDHSIQLFVYFSVSRIMNVINLWDQVIDVGMQHHLVIVLLKHVHKQVE